jgi:pimeloyl-ACP methyl ester carboxylesterase
MAPEARRLRGLGYRTFAVNYRAGVQAFPDVVAAYERLRRTYGARTPICAYGSSAGAHMALMLAIRRPDLACVVAQAPPTVLTGLSRGLRHDAQVAFEPLGGLEEWSPANYRLYTPTLIEQGRTDPVVPLGDSIAMHQTAPNSKLLLLAHGANKWIHTGISDTALHTSLRTERTFLRAATTRWSQQGPWRPATPSA